MAMLEIDGSMGEGGGQILRTALTLSLVTGRPFRIVKVRARRRRPGLLRQHLTAVEAARAVGRARVEGATLGSGELAFFPSEIAPGEYRFAVGSAGSTTLVLQTILPALAAASGPSLVHLEGGTHNPLAPPFPYLERVFLPVLERMGPRARARLERPGFFPAGGGRATVEIHPAALVPLHLRERGALRRCSARALVSRLPKAVAQRELQVVREELGWEPEALQVEEVRDASGPGNVLFLEVEYEGTRELVTGFGRKGLRAEEVARGAVRELARFMRSDVPVGEHLADQLLLPLSLAGGGSFRTLRPSSHTHTNARAIQAFLDVEVRLAEEGADRWLLEVRPGKELAAGREGGVKGSR